MAKQLQLRRGTTAEHSSFTGLEGEVTMDTTTDQLRVHDGSTASGKPVAGVEVNRTAPYTLGIGENALDSATGEQNTALGDETLTANTSGYKNVAVGNQALKTNISGFENTGVGMWALEDATGDRNTAIGSVALGNVSDGDHNVGVGAGAGDNITSGSNNIMIGYNVDAQSATASNQINIGDKIKIDSSGNLDMTFPSGHVIKTHHLTYRITSPQTFAISSTFTAVEYSSPGGAMTISGISATEGNLLHISGHGGTVHTNNDGSYTTFIGFLIDGEEHLQFEGFNYDQNSYGQYGYWNGHIGMLYTVPASFTSKTISLACGKEGAAFTHQMRAETSRGPVTLWMLISEIQQ